MIPTLPKEAWFENAPPAGDELASIIIPCWNQVDMTRACLESLMRHTRTPFEIIIVDNGSSDGTIELCAEFRRTVEPVSNRLEDAPVGNRPHENPYLQRFEVIRNETNLGFAAATNQGLARARGSYLVLLNNDTVVTESWLERLIECSLARWPKVGMVGPVSNYAPAPQLVGPEYDDLDALGAFARRRVTQFQGQALPVPRLTGFCLLLRREVYDAITKNVGVRSENVGEIPNKTASSPSATADGSSALLTPHSYVLAPALDERFGMGFFEDDDLCFRARDAGYELLVALDVYIHHRGSTTFKAAGIETGQLLRENFAKFQAKWGTERTAPYQMPEEQKKETGDRSQESGENTDASLGSSLLPPASCLLSPFVSLCMIVKNEEDNLPACLASVAGLTDEIIVVDTGSTDRTREIARDAGAKVFEFPWVDSFAAARNESIRHATGEWIFWMDADDRLDEENREKLRRLFASLRSEHVGVRSENVGVRSEHVGVRNEEVNEFSPKDEAIAQTPSPSPPTPLPRVQGRGEEDEATPLPLAERSLSPDSSLLRSHSSLLPTHSSLLASHSCFVMKCLCLPDRETGTATVVDHIRLFRNDPRIRWRYRIHEQILIGVRLAGGEARWSDVVIHHTGYQDPARRGPKLERDVRLLEMDLAEHPDEPFTLFNLGWSVLKQGRPAEALAYLRRSLEKSGPADSVVRKIYALMVQCQIQLGDVQKALDVCRAGRRACPDDAEILFEEGSIHLEQGNLTAAEAGFIQLLERKPGTYFASVDPALCGYKSRHSLGVVYHKQKRYAEAQGEWQKVLAERGDYVPTLLALGELYVEQKEWQKLEHMVEDLERLPGAKVESAILRAQGHMARREFAAAKSLLVEVKERFPNSLLPRVLMSHALLQEDTDHDAAERALREILAMDPNHEPARQNLRVLLSQKAG